MHGEISSVSISQIDSPVWSSVFSSYPHHARGSHREIPTEQYATQTLSDIGLAGRTVRVDPVTLQISRLKFVLTS